MIEIGEMVIRVPGVSREEGQRLSIEIAEILARRFAQNRHNLNLQLQDLQINLNSISGKDRLAEVIAEAIVKKIQNL